jgi:tetratricopeptide (TPR) repeat protein
MTLTPARPRLETRLALALLVAVGLSFAPEARAQAGPGAPPATQSGAEDPAAVFARGRELLEAGDAAGAAAAFEAMLSGGIDHPAVRSNLGAAFSRMGRYDEAVEQHRRALELSGGNPAVRQNLAIALSKAGRIPEAAEEARRVTEAQPDNRGAVLLLADCDLRMGESARVVALLDPLAGRAVDDEAVAYLLGMALMKEGELDRAQRVIDGILRRDTPQAHLLLATMSVAAGDCARALQELDRAATLGPPLPTAGFLRGQCLMEENDWAGAVQAFRDEVAVDPNHFEAQLLLGTLLREANRPEEALVHLERAGRMRPDNVSVHYGLGSVLADQGRDAEALEHLQRVVEMAPDDMKARVQLAAVYFRLGRGDDAARERDAVMRLVAEQQARSADGVRGVVSETIGGERTSPEVP